MNLKWKKILKKIEVWGKDSFLNLNLQMYVSRSVFSFDASYDYVYCAVILQK